MKQWELDTTGNKKTCSTSHGMIHIGYIGLHDMENIAALNIRRKKKKKKREPKTKHQPYKYFDPKIV